MAILLYSNHISTTIFSPATLFKYAYVYFVIQTHIILNNYTGTKELLNFNPLPWCSEELCNVEFMFPNYLQFLVLEVSTTGGVN